MDTIQITCPSCKKAYKMVKPAKEGTYKITCPYCKVPSSIRFVDDAKSKGSDTIPNASSSSGTASADDASYKSIKCTHCGVTLKLKSSLKGTFKITCPKCHTAQAVKLGDAEAPSSPQQEKTLKTHITNKKTLNSAAKLVQLRRFRSNVTFELKEGENIIGRTDSTQVSDISISTDDTMSRRSAVIEVVQSGGSYLFKFKVLKATNPVYHNNKVLAVGESIYLNYGDRIVLGKTHFLFDKL